ncbi:MAG: hypothetical protein AAFR21_18380 [Pseudomonadota bacterium]
MTNSVEKLQKLWGMVEPLLLPYEGSASQLYVLDLPMHDLERTIDIFRQHAHKSVICTLAGYTYPEDKRPLCDDVSKIDILRASSENKNSIISGQLWKERQLNYWIWPDFEKQQFDAELVFWADKFFTASMDEQEKISSFGTVHAIAEKFRENAQGCECVLSSHETGDPRDGREEDHTVFW